MRQRKWLVIPALIAVGCVILLGILMLLPTPKSGFEPDWLLKLPPTSDKQKIYRVNLSPITDMLVTQRAWTLKEPWPATLEQLNKDFPGADGWTKEANLGQVSWERFDVKTSQGFTVFAMPIDNEIRLQTHTSRPLSWLEKTQRSLRKFFGVQEK